MMEIKPYAKNAKKQFTCKNCNKQWIDYRSNDKNKAFCSIACKSAFSRIDRTCKECKTAFSVCESTLRSSNASGNYCSRDCYWNSMRTGVIRHKNGFRGIVRRCFPGIQQCARCGVRKKGIHIHHIVPFRYTQNNDLTNLIPLCNSCHKVVECLTENVLKVDKDYERVSFMMNNMLRDRQAVTAFVCK